MKQLLTILIFISALFNCRAQTSPMLDIPNGKSAVYIDGDYQFASDAITSNFLNHITHSHYIDKGTKDEVAGNLKLNNAFDASMNSRIMYFRQMKNKNLHLYLSFEEHDLVISSFTKNLFELVMNGNAQFAGKWTYMNEMYMNYLRYQQLHAGLVQTIKRNDRTHTIGGAIVYNNGSGNVFVDVIKSSLYTQPDGEYIDMNINSHICRTDTSNANKPIPMNGHGFSFDLFYSYLNKKGNGFRLELLNTGYIKWKSTSFDTYADKSYHYDGFNVDLLNYSNDNLVKAKRDSILRDLVYSGKGSYQTNMPFYVNMLYERTLIPEKLRLAAGLKCMFFTGNSSYIYLKPIYTFYTNYRIAPMISYNSYGKYNWGLDLTACLAHDYFITLRSVNLNGYLDPHKATSQGFFVSITKTFNRK